MKGSKEPRTRFVCGLPNQESEIFSAKERKNGGLIISIKSAVNYTADAIQPEESKILDQKYSIHLSNDGSSATLHHTIKLHNGVELDSCVFQSDSLNLCAPIFVRVCGQLNLPHYIVKARAHDKVVSISQIGDPCTIFIVGVLISGKNIKPQDRDFPGLGFHAEDFTNFRLNIIYGHILLPAIGEGTLLHFSTNSPRKDKEFIGPDFRSSQLATLKLEKATSIHLIQSMLTEAVLAHIEKIKRQTRCTEPGAEELNQSINVLSRSIFPSIPIRHK